MGSLSTFNSTSQTRVVESFSTFKDNGKGNGDTQDEKPRSSPNNYEFKLKGAVLLLQQITVQKL